jgi:acetyl esterase
MPVDPPAQALIGVPVETSRYDGQLHGFFSMYWFMDAAQKAVDEAASALREALS